MHVCHRVHYLRVYMRMRVSAWLRAWECVLMCEHMCLCVCVHVYTRARVCASVRAEGETTFSRVLFLRRLHINCLPISILPN